MQSLILATCPPPPPTLFFFTTPNPPKPCNPPTAMAAQLHLHRDDHHPLSRRPDVRQSIKLATAATVGLAAFVLAGLTMTGTVLAVVLMTPLLVLFSPVLVPAAIAACLASAGFLIAGGCGAAALAIASWMYSYSKGQHPIGSDKLDGARRVVGDIAVEIKEKVADATDTAATVTRKKVQHKGQLES